MNVKRDTNVPLKSSVQFLPLIPSSSSNHCLHLLFVLVLLGDNFSNCFVPRLILFDDIVNAEEELSLF